MVHIKRTAVALTLISALFVSILVGVQAAKATGNFWVKRASMPNSEDFVQTAVVDGEIYVIGSNNTANTNYNYLYHPSTDSWVSKTPMPTIQMGAAIATYQNKIYMIGGGQGLDINFTTYQTSTNEMYDPTTDTWTNKTSMPMAYANLQAATVNGMIYVMGGTTATLGKMNIYGINELYNPATDSWQSLTPMPIPAYEFGMVAIGDKIYLIGGITDAPTHYCNQTQIYDTQTNTWSSGTPMPITTSGVVAAVTTGDFAPVKIYCIGNKLVLKYYQSLHLWDWTYTMESPIQIYDPQTGNWTIGASSPTTRISGAALAVVNDTVYVIGGYDGTGQTSANEQYFPLDYRGALPPLSPSSLTVLIVSPENITYTMNNVPLTFVVNKQIAWVGYSLDGQDNVTLSGNTTITGLQNGLHNIRIYANDTYGIMAASEPVSFTVDVQEPFPTTLVITASGVSMVVAGIGLLVYFKKRKQVNPREENSAATKIG